MSEDRPDGTSESMLTVVVAGVANLTIAVAKAVGAVISGSAAMLSEAVHSVADTITEVLLFVALRRGGRPPDARHPFGYGREGYLWALLAAMATFLVGAVVSVYEGIGKIRSGEHEGSPLVAFVVLAVAFVIEGISLRRAVSQVRTSARRWRMRPSDYLRRTTDTAVKAVAFEDSAALVGLALAGAGLALTEVTGSALWDGLASILIGLLLVVVATSLARANSSLLIGQAAPVEVERGLREELMGLDGIDAVPVLVTSVLGPDRFFVAAKVSFRDDITTDDLERVADEAERRLVARYPGIEYVFLDPTADGHGVVPGVTHAAPERHDG